MSVAERVCGWLAGQKHDVAMISARVHHFLCSVNIIGGVIESKQIMSIDSFIFQDYLTWICIQNVGLIMGPRRTLRITVENFHARKKVGLQLWNKCLSDLLVLNIDGQKKATDPYSRVIRVAHLEQHNIFRKILWLPNNVMYIRSVWYRILMISMQSGGSDLANLFLTALDRCQLGNIYFMTRSGEPTFSDTVLKFSLPDFSHEEQRNEILTNWVEKESIVPNILICSW